jgi:hypothetical protein
MPVAGFELPKSYRFGKSIHSTVLSKVRYLTLRVPDIDTADIGKGMPSSFAYTLARMFGRGW